MVHGNFLESATLLVAYDAYEDNGYKIVGNVIFFTYVEINADVVHVVHFLLCAFVGTFFGVVGIDVVDVVLFPYSGNIVSFLHGVQVGLFEYVRNIFAVVVNVFHVATVSARKEVDDESCTLFA